MPLIDVNSWEPTNNWAMIKALRDCDGLSHAGDMDIFTLAEVRLDISGDNREENLERKGNMAAPEPFSRPLLMLILIRLGSAWALGCGRDCDCQLLRNHIWIFEYADLNFQNGQFEFSNGTFGSSNGAFEFSNAVLSAVPGPFEFSNASFEFSNGSI